MLRVSRLRHVKLRNLGDAMPIAIFMTCVAFCVDVALVHTSEFQRGKAIQITGSEIYLVGRRVVAEAIDDGVRDQSDRRCRASCRGAHGMVPSAAPSRDWGADG